VKDRRFIVTGTDTGVGKTTLSALLMSALPGLSYWKPVQSGLEEETDSACVRRISGCDEARILPERYLLPEPLSPHTSAARAGVSIEADELLRPDISPLLIEGAGGLLVPLNEETLFIDVFERWGLPVLVACRSGLGTINHTLLTLEALQKRGIPVLGLVTIGDYNPANEEALEYFGGATVVGRIPQLAELNAERLREVYDKEFSSFDSLWMDIA
jgi:dethiobiotin synthetase